MLDLAHPRRHPYACARPPRISACRWHLFPDSTSATLPLRPLMRSVPRRNNTASVTEEMRQRISEAARKVTCLVPKRSPEILLEELNNIQFSMMLLEASPPQLSRPLIEKMISIQENEVPLIPDSHALKGEVLLGLGNLFGDQVRKNGELQYIERGIACMGQALSRSVDGDTGKPEQLGKLAQLLLYRFEILGKLPDVDQAIEYNSQGVSLASDELKLDLLQNLGASYIRRFERLGERRDIDAGVESLTQAVCLTPQGSESIPDLLDGLGGAHLHRFERLGMLYDLDGALEYLTAASLIEGRAETPGSLNNISVCHLRRFESLGELHDINKAIEYLTQGISVTPKGHASIPAQLNNLGGCYARRFERLGDLRDLQRAIEYQSQAISLTPENSPYKPAWLIALGFSYEIRFQRLGELDDLNKATECQTKAVLLTPKDHGEMANWLNSLGCSHQTRFHRLGKIQDIDKAVEYHTRATSEPLASEEHPDLPMWLNNLGNAHSRRFSRLGEMRDIDRAIECHAQAVSLTSKERLADLAKRLNNLGSSYRDRFARSGEIHEINKAIECHNRTLLITPDGHTFKPLRLQNLGSSHKCRFDRLGEIYDIDKAIEYQAQALLLAPEDHARLPCILHGLGDSHRARFTGHDSYEVKMHHIDKAIEYLTRAAALIPEGHANMPDILDSLGDSLKARFSRLGSNTHIFLITSESSLPESRFYHLAEELGFRHLGERHDIERAMECFRASARCSTGKPWTRFVAARKWGRIAASYGISSPLPAYQHAMDLVPQIVWLGSTIDQRYKDIQSIGYLVTEAASVAISLQKYALALEWLEQGRSIVWKQKLQLQTPLDELASAHPKLAEDFKEVADALSKAGSQGPGITTLHSSYSPRSEVESLEESARQHRRLADRYDELINQVRQLPGFDSFLRPKSASDLKAAAKDGPLVIINVHMNRCDALILQHNVNDILHVPLPTLSHEKVAKAQTKLLTSLRQQGIRERGEFRPLILKSKRNCATANDDLKLILTDLWSDMVHPVLESLGYTETRPEDKLPHITWCTTGPLSFLPIHAAGRYDQPHPRIFDLAISSYTPTISALLPKTLQEESPDFRVERGHIRCSRDAAGKLKMGYSLTLVPNPLEPSGILAVGQAATPGHSPLPNTVDELAALEKYVGALPYMQLDGGEATTTAVLDAMEKHSWVHLACHAGQDRHNPAASGFRLHDGTLNLAMIGRKLFKQKGLAFLSACQTAAGDEQLPDEAVHLAAGMLMIGYQSVIATVWSIMDEDAPVVADKVYAQLLKDGKLNNTGAARALHFAMRILRGKVGEEAFVRWVPYIHMGI